MAKRSLLVAAVAMACMAGSAGVSVAQLGRVGPGGVVGGGSTTTRSSATAPSRPAVTISLPAPITIPLPSSFPVEAEDPIDRPEFQNKAHPITKNLTTATSMMIQEASSGFEVGVTSDVIANVAAGSRQAKESKAVFISKQAKVGPEMETSFDEAIRAIQVRYPQWEPGRIEFSFGDKYTPHDGGSAGTVFGALLLSELEGFTIDTKCAVTGDITVNWRVKEIGGLPAKLRGAAANKCLYAGVPVENSNDVMDMALMYTDGSLSDIQVFSLESLQDAVRLMRTDRPPRLAAAIKSFTELQPRLKLGKPALEDKTTQRLLEQVLALAPNHVSAKWLLEIGRGTAPKSLSTTYALEQIFIAIYPYRYIISGREPVSRVTVSSTMTAGARKQLSQLAPITPVELQPLVMDARAIIETTEGVANNQTKMNILEDKVNAFLDHYVALSNNKELIEKMVRGGQ